jgi:hypothetical protein
MFSRSTERPDLVVVSETGLRERVRLSRYSWQARGVKEAQGAFESAMPDHLCEAIPHTASVIGWGRVHRCE